MLPVNFENFSVLWRNQSVFFKSSLKMLFIWQTIGIYVTFNSFLLNVISNSFTQLPRTNVFMQTFMVSWSFNSVNKLA